MTDEQRARRAEIARENGANSKGPVSITGKYISSLNGIATGDHATVRKEELPECIALLSTDCLRIPMMPISQSDLMPISSEASNAGLSQCELVIGIRQGFLRVGAA